MLFVTLLAGAAAVVSLTAEPGAAGVANADSPTVTLTTPGFPDPTTPLTGDVDLFVTTSATIASVAFQDSPAGRNEWTTLQTTTTPPLNTLTLDTTTLADGLYDLRAVVTDTTGDALTSAPLTDRLIANNSPVVTLSSPGSILAGTVQLSATDETGDPNGGELADVTFQESPSGQEKWTTIAANVASDSDGSFTAAFDTTSVPDGLHDLRVIATDGSGDYYAAIPLRSLLVDNTPPNVSLSAPPSTLSGEVTVSAAATDSGSGVQQVQFQYAPAGSTAWSTFATATDAPYQGVLNTYGMSGNYDLRAVATDVAGNQATSAVLGPFAIDNPVEAAPVTASVTGVIAPATSIAMLGTVTDAAATASADESDPETWAYGFTSAPPAEVDGARLPYTAEGNQLVLMRYTHDGGWQIEDVLRDDDGTAFRLLPATDVSAVHVTGAMAPSGEGWILVTETPTSASGLAPVIGLFHRGGDSPKAQFLLDPELDPGSPSYSKPLATMLSDNLGGAQLHIGWSGGQIYGVLTAPQQPQIQQSVAAPSGGGNVVIDEALEYALLQPDGTWSVRSVPMDSLPSSYVPQAGDTIELTHADVSGPDAGWGTLTVVRSASNSQTLPLLLGQFDGSTWSFTQTGQPALDLTGKAVYPMTEETVFPSALRAFGNDVWVEATVAFRSVGAGGVTGSANVVARIDASTGQMLDSWCTLPGAYSAACEEPLDADNPAAVPDAVFPSGDGGEVGLALDDNYVDVFADDRWTRVAAPGYAPSGGSTVLSTFSGANQGWLAGGHALGHWSTPVSSAAPNSSSNPLVSWPLPDRSPLTAIAVPPGSASDSTESQALAVGLNGTTLYYDEADGWLPAALPTSWQFAPPPPQAGHINLLGAAFDGPTSAFAVGQYGAILRWDGTTWSEDPQSFALTEEQLNAVAFAADGEGWAVGANGTILHYDGQSWSIQSPPAEDVGVDITSVTVAGSTVYAVAGGNLIELDAGASASGATGASSATGATGATAATGSSGVIGFTGATGVSGSSAATGVSGSTAATGGGGSTAATGTTGTTGATGASGAGGQRDASWEDVPASAFPSDPAPVPGDLRLVSGLPDGGVVAAGVDELLSSPASGVAFDYSAQPLQGIAVALAPFRQSDGDLGAFVSVAPPVAGSNDVGGSPPGDGELMRLTDSGWQDLSEAQYAGTAGAGDGVVKSDPVLAVASDPSGEHAWAAGGYAGTVSASGVGTYTILAARSAAWDTASIWRYDEDPSGTATPPQLSASTLSIPAQQGTVSFAYFSSPECRWECSAVENAQPDVNLSSAATQVASYAAQPGGPAFAVLGGNDRGPVSPIAGETYDAASEYGSLKSLLAPLGGVPLFGVLGDNDHVNPGDDPGLTDPLQPWASAFIEAPAPFGVGAPAAGISTVSGGAATDGVSRYYAFDAAQNGGTLRVIVLDNSANSVGAPGSLGSVQTNWLAAQLADAQAANLPVVVFAAEPLRPVSGGAADANAVAAMLANAGVLAVFTTNPSQLNQHYLIPTDAAPGAPQIEEYEGASLGYQQSANNGVDWYFVSVDTATRSVSLDAVPLVSSIALEPVEGLTVARSVTLQFNAIARRPAGTLATYATGTSDDGFPGIDQYLEVPAASCGSSPCIEPSYSFTSSDPTIGTFVKPSGAGSRYPALNASGDPIPDPTSGLFCAYNSGTTTVSVTAGLLTYSLPVTVQPGEFGAPCGTVYRPGVNKIEVVIGPSVAGQAAIANATAPPPPASAAPITAAPAPIVLPVPLQHPPAVPVKPPPAPPAPRPAAAVPTPVPAPAPTPQTPIVVVPTPPTPVQPTPPGGSPVPVGGVAQSPAAARREEKAHKHASQSAFTVRPAGVAGADWFYATAGAASVLTLLLLAAAFRPSSGLRPALLRSERKRPPRGGGRGAG